MNVAALRIRITIQKNTTVVDSIGNHTSDWENYYTCWATATSNGKSSEETTNAAHTEEADRMDFTVRWSSETEAVNSKQYRVLLGDRIYDILSIDDMGFKRKSRKLMTRLTER